MGVKKRYNLKLRKKHSRGNNGGFYYCQEDCYSKFNCFTHKIKLWFTLRSFDLKILFIKIIPLSKVKKLLFLNKTKINKVNTLISSAQISNRGGLIKYVFGKIYIDLQKIDHQLNKINWDNEVSFSALGKIDRRLNKINWDNDVSFKPLGKIDRRLDKINWDKDVSFAFLSKINRLLDSVDWDKELKIFTQKKSCEKITNQKKACHLFKEAPRVCNQLNKKIFDNCIVNSFLCKKLNLLSNRRQKLLLQDNRQKRRLLLSSVEISEKEAFALYHATTILKKIKFTLKYAEWKYNITDVNTYLEKLLKIKPEYQKNNALQKFFLNNVLINVPKRNVYFAILGTALLFLTGLGSLLYISFTVNTPAIAANISKLNNFPELAALNNNVVEMPSINKGSLIEDGLVGFWKLNGNAMDATANGNNGVVYGEINSNGERYIFDNVDDYITLGNNSLFDLTSTGSISVWVKADRSFPSDSTNIEYHPIVSKTAHGNNSGIAYWMDWYGTNKKRILRAKISDGKTNIGFNIFDFDFGKGWNHLVFTWDSNYLKLYKNGSLYDEPMKQLVDAQALPEADLNIGRAFNSNVYLWDGQIANLKIYNNALEIEDIEKLFTEF